MGTFYVSTAGDDLNFGTSTLSPWRTLQKALNSAGAGTHTVYVRVGTYIEAVETYLHIQTAGAGHTWTSVTFVGCDTSWNVEQALAA